MVGPEAVPNGLPPSLVQYTVDSDRIQLGRTDQTEEILQDFYRFS